MRKSVTILAMLFCSIAACMANTNDYETIKSSLNEKSLPLVNITVEIDKVNKPEYTPATIEVTDPQKRTNGEESVTFNCKVKYRGASSSGYDKKSFAVKLLNEKGKSLDASMFGIREDDAWILDAMAVDRIRMRNRLNFDIWNAMSQTPYNTDNANRNGTMGYFVELFINGEYHGLYCFTDKVNRKLLGVKKAKENDDNSVTIKGVVYKCASWDDSAFLKGYDEQDMNNTIWNAWELDYPDDYPCEEAYMPLKDFIDFCAKTTDTEFADGLDDNLYIKNFTDYHVFVISQGLTDNAMKNTFLSIVDKNKGKRIMITPWDLDASLGGYWDGRHYDYNAQNSTILAVRPYKRLWDNDVNGYADAVANRWRKFVNKGILSKEAVNERIDSYANAFIESGAWQREYDKWNNNPVPLEQDITVETNYVKRWYSHNFDNIEGVFKEYGTTYIKDVETDNDNDGTLYNVLGQKVNHTYKGIVIKKGKKTYQM